MATTTHRPATQHLATAPAYLRQDLATGLADVICGQQADWILTTLHPDEDVTPAPGGVFRVRPAGTDTPDVEYLPLAARRSRDAAQYLFSTSPDGLTQQARGTRSRAQTRQLTDRAQGQIHTLADGTIVSLYRGRRAATWTPLPKERC